MPKIPRLLVILALLLGFGAGVALHGTTLQAVTVELLPGAEEPADGGLLGLGGGKPDYRVEIDLGTRRVVCETLPDTPIGDGLRFEVPGRPPRAAVVGLRLVEDDAANDDLLEDLPVEGDAVEGDAFEGDVVEGQAYRFTLETGWSVLAGIEGFLGTPEGVLLAVLLSMGAVVLAGGLALRGALEE
jgi:hypothetical protein